MSNLAIFPELMGLTMEITMTPSFSTGVSTSSNGKETRTAYQDYPKWDFNMSYEWLPNRKRGKRDLETIIGFWLERQGSFESFLLDVPETPIEEMILLGTGDGTTTTFPLLRTVGTFVEPAGGVEDKLKVQLFLDNVPVAFTAFNMAANDRDVVFTAAPAVSKQIRAVYTPLYRVRFTEDSAEFSRFSTLLWELQEISFRSVFD